MGGAGAPADARQDAPPAPVLPLGPGVPPAGPLCCTLPAACLPRSPLAPSRCRCWRAGWAWPPPPSRCGTRTCAWRRRRRWETSRSPPSCAPSRACSRWGAQPGWLCYWGRGRRCARGRWAWPAASRLGGDGTWQRQSRCYPAAIHRGSASPAPSCCPLQGLVGASGRRPLRIVDGASGVLRPGRFTLLLAPPGSGKTTLLRALSGRLREQADLSVGGTILYNGHPFSSFVPERSAAYISQVDLHYPELTGGGGGGGVVVWCGGVVVV